MKKVLLFVVALGLCVMSISRAEDLIKTEANPQLTKIDVRMTELQAQAKELTEKKTQLQNGLMQIDQNLLMLQGAYNELTKQKTELEKPLKTKK